VALQAIAIGAPLARWLGRKRASRIIARFDSTVQLESEDGRLWAITTRNNPGAFRAVVLALPERHDFALSYSANALWNPRPRRRALTRAEKQSAARLLAAQIDAANFPEARGAWDVIADEWRALPRELREGDVDALRGAMSRVVGRGTGLTPTGDDFAQALLVALASGDARDRAAFRALARALTPLLATTTRMSRAFLDQALRGYAFGPLRDLLDTLPNAPRDKVDALLRVGASSGAAYSLGVLMGLSYELD
jgi:hypothetical protein